MKSREARFGHDVALRLPSETFRERIRVRLIDLLSTTNTHLATPEQRLAWCEDILQHEPSGYLTTSAAISLVSKKLACKHGVKVAWGVFPGVKMDKPTLQHHKDGATSPA